jgi:hypothetical protein
VTAHDDLEEILTASLRQILHAHVVDGVNWAIEVARENPELIDELRDEFDGIHFSCFERKMDTRDTGNMENKWLVEGDLKLIT